MQNNYSNLRTKSKTRWLISLLVISIGISLVLAIYFIIEPGAYIVVISLPLFFSIVRIIYLLRSNTMNHKTHLKMKTRVFFAVTILIGLFMISGIKVDCQTHVVLNTFNVNIRTGPGTDYAVLCMAGKGEIFRLISDSGDWVEISMYSDDSRYIHKDLVYFLDEFVYGHNMRLPESESKTKQFYQDIRFATLNAKHEAVELIPESVSKDYHENYFKICMDKKTHDIFELYGQQTAMYPQLIELATEKGW